MWQHPHLDGVLPSWTKNERQSPGGIDLAVSLLLPDSECSQLLLEWGIIADPRGPRAQPAPASPTNFLEGLPAGCAILF
jgi:hypothetical protein